MSLSSFMKDWEAKHAELVKKYGEDFDKPAITFGLNRSEAAVVDEWLQSLLPEILAIQNTNLSDTSFRDILQSGEPYYGAVGGGVTYSFIPTSLGTIIIAKESITGKELNVSDACDWYFYG